MGRKDLKTRKAFDWPQNFADAINIANGDRIISPQYLKPYSEHNISTGLRKYHETVPDNVKMYDYKQGDDHLLTVIFLENNDYVDYSYVAHILFEMALKVYEEVNEVKAMHRQKKDLKGDRYIASFDETDRITAVAALVVYTGRENADVPNQISDLYEGYDPRLDNMVLHFKAKMLNAHHVKDAQLALADGEIGKFFKVVRCGEDVKKMSALMQTAEFYEIEDETIADLIYDHLNLNESTRKELEQMRKEGEPIHMSKEFKFISDERAAALKNEGIEEGMEKGMEKGLKQGVQEGMRKSENNIIRNMILQHFSNDQIKSVSGKNDEEINAIRLSLNHPM